MFARIRDLKVYYNVRGNGHPLILLHGGGSDSQTWDDMLPYLAEHFKVYEMDLRGFGQTVRKPAPHLSLDLWTSDLHDFMDSLGLDRAALAGWSLGGAIGISFAALYPKRVSHLILIGTPGPTVVLNLSGFRERTRLVRNGATMQEVIEKTFEFTKSSMSPYTIENNSSAVEKAKQALLRNSPSNYAEMVEALGDLNLGPKLSAITCPTLILVGDADSRTPLAASEELNRGISQSYVKIIPNCGHQYAYEQPETVAAAMLEFLATFGACSRQ